MTTEGQGKRPRLARLLMKRPLQFGQGARIFPTIRLPEDPDGDGRCRLREPQVGARAKTASRVATAHHQTPTARPSRWWAWTWIVERTFAWLARNRRLSKDYELKVQTSE